MGQKGGKEDKKGGVKLSKQERKIAKKHAKMRQIVLSDTGVKVTETPNEWVVIWGVGVATGTGKAKLFNYFDNHLNEIRMFVDKSYIIASCFDLEKAKSLVERFNGTKFDEKQTLFIGYIEEGTDIPEEDKSYRELFSGPLPAGMFIYSDFVDEREEVTIMQKLLMDMDLESTSDSKSKLKNRRVKHYGYEFRYDTNDVDPSDPLPDSYPGCLDSVVQTMLKQNTIAAYPDQVTVNYYEPGQGIPAHCDTHSAFMGPIVSLSLGSHIIMDFRKDGKVRSVILPRYSLLIMEGECRFGWTHGITPRTYDIIPYTEGGFTVMERGMRLSVTFRLLNVPRTPCQCSFPELCDSQQGKITNENAEEIENELVHKVYDNISDHFADTRHTPWPKIKEFVENIPSGSKLLDVGCANGKYFGINKEIFEVGTDMSFGLLKKCYDKGHEAVRANALNLPFKDQSFEAVICIAVLHHVATKERRLILLNEIYRVMMPGATALIYVWAKEQIKGDKKSTWSERQEAQKPYATPTPSTSTHGDKFAFLPIHERDSEFHGNDLKVPWVNKKPYLSDIPYRFYHVFMQGELETLIEAMEIQPVILEKYYEEGNWAVLIQKPK